MSEPTAVTSTDVTELDVREIPKPLRHSLIFERFAALSPAGSFVLINSHDPKHLRQEFERDHPGTYDWRYLQTGPVWRIQISKLTGTDLPRVLCDAQALATDELTGDAAGAVWKLTVAQRHLDANIIHLQPDTGIESHTGPDLDVLMHVLAGAGHLTNELEDIPLKQGALVWLPRQSRRSITAGPAGLSYLTVHPRRPGLSINAASSREPHQH